MLKPGNGVWQICGRGLVGAAIAALGGVAVAPAVQAQAIEPAPHHAMEASASPWRLATEEEQEQTWSFVLSSPLGIAALNQLAIEGFISPVCPKTLYVHSEYGGFQTLLRVQCPTERGVSIARSYSEVRVIFNRFEDNIEGFELERVYEDTPPDTVLPE